MQKELRKVDEVMDEIRIRKAAQLFKGWALCNPG